MGKREINNNRKNLSFLSLVIAEHQNSVERTCLMVYDRILKKLSFGSMFRISSKCVFRQVAGQKSFWRPKVVIPVINPVILVILQLTRTETNNKTTEVGMDRANQKEQENQSRWDRTLQRLADEWNSQLN